MLFLLSNWKWIASVVAAATLTGYLAWNLHSWDVERINTKHEKALVAQAKALDDKCTADKQITTEVTNEQLRQIAGLNDQLAALKRVRPNRCVAVVPGSARDGHAAAQDEKLPHAHGLFTDDLYQFAYDAEEVGIQLDSCQDYIRRAIAK